MSDRREHGSETTAALLSIALPCIVVLLIMACCHGCHCAGYAAATASVVWWEDLLAVLSELIATAAALLGA